MFNLNKYLPAGRIHYKREVVEEIGGLILVYSKGSVALRYYFCHSLCPIHPLNSIFLALISVGLMTVVAVAIVVCSENEILQFDCSRGLDDKSRTRFFPFPNLLGPADPRRLFFKKLAE